jgi:hypothetical protein
MPLRAVGVVDKGVVPYRTTGGPHGGGLAEPHDQRAEHRVGSVDVVGLHAGCRPTRPRRRGRWRGSRPPCRWCRVAPGGRPRLRSGRPPGAAARPAPVPPAARRRHRCGPPPVVRGPAGRRWPGPLATAAADGDLAPAAHRQELGVQVEQGGGVLVDDEDGGAIGELGFQGRQAPLVHVAVAGVVGAALGVVVVRDEPNRPWAADQCIDGQVGCYRASSRSA